MADITDHLKTLFILPFIFFVFACEDVVDVQTADAPKQIVVDAWLTNQPVRQEIKLTYSQPYFNSDFAEPATGASVEIMSSTGKQFFFEETSTGIYSWTGASDEILGNPGDQFELTIVLDNQTLTASSTMFPVPAVDSIRQEYREDELSGPDGIYTQFFARDLPGLGNTYWIKSFKNGEYLNKPEEINLAFDAGFDGGSQLDGLIFIPPIRELTNPIPDDFPADDAPYQEGDKIRVEIHSISLEAFEFMSMVRDQILNGSNTIFAFPIANSQGNIQSDNQNNALGVFCVSAVSVAEREIN
ncbi:MAG: DUF4249 domain-containing protein [Saprospiraceae bacterium]|nr:DUF4249 domain-containing protein [Saprospiraceae bacterium]